MNIILMHEKEFSQLVGRFQSSERPTGWKPAGRKKYTTKAGDSLSNISREFYKNTGYWDIIYLENFGKIGRNPDQLNTGVSLTIP